MTNKQLLNTYSDFLSIYCGCHADSMGNRPCDNGVLCDRCMTKEMRDLWQAVKNDPDIKARKDIYYIYIGDKTFGVWGLDNAKAAYRQACKFAEMVGLSACLMNCIHEIIPDDIDIECEV